MSSRGRRSGTGSRQPQQPNRPAAGAGRRGGGRAASGSTGQRPAARPAGAGGSRPSASRKRAPARREPAEEPQHHRRRKPNNNVPIIVSSVVLVVVAVVLFVMLRSKTREERIDARIAEIESEPVTAAPEIDGNAAVGAAIREVLESQERSDDAVKTAADEEAARLARQRERSRYEVRKLGHLETTPDDQKAKIDSLVEDLVQDDDIRRSNKARSELIDMRRPAVPRLLNRLVELEMDDEDHIMIANVIHRTLAEMVRLPEGDEISFIPQEETVGRMVKQRQNAIKRWFQWWGDNEKTFE